MSMFIRALFAIAKTWRHPKCIKSPTDGWIKKVWYMCMMEHYSAIKQNKIMPFCNNMDETRDDHTKLNKSERKRQIPYDITYMWNLKYGTDELI